MKQIAAEHAVTFIQSGMTVGLGTGSTAAFAIQKIGALVQNNQLQIKAIATSQRSEDMARALNIPIITFEDFEQIDITIDGADEVDSELHLIKGGGGALLREKIVADNSRQVIIIADESKLVKQLGKFALPVEVVPFALTIVQRQLQRLGCIATLRMQKENPYVTDNSNLILDCDFGRINNPSQLHNDINAITGVVDNGLFIQQASMVITAFNDGSVQTLQRNI